MYVYLRFCFTHTITSTKLKLNYYYYLTFYLSISALILQRTKRYSRTYYITLSTKTLNICIGVLTIPTYILLMLIVILFPKVF